MHTLNLYAGCLITLAIVLRQITADFSQEAVVYPTLLESRDDTGQYVVSLDDGTTLRLRSSSAIEDSLTLHTFEDGKRVVRNVDTTEIRNALYESQETMSSLLVYETGNGVRLEGVLNHTHRIQPSSAMERSEQGRIAHIVHKIPTMTPSEDDTVLSGPGFQEARMNVEERILPEVVYPEIFIVSDSKHNEVFSTENKFVSYMVVFFASVVLRYAGVTHPRIVPKLVGLERATYHSEREFIQMYDRERMVAEYTLDEFARYVLQRTDNYRGVDVILLLTGRPMVTVISGTVKPGVAGLAYTAGMCTKRRFAESIDRRGFYEGVRHAAHELAHSFGAGHDGSPGPAHVPGNQGAYHCLWDYGFLMSYVTRDLNQFLFSSCSQQQFRAFFSYVPDWCINRTYSGRPLKPSGKLPGDRLSADKFCVRLTRDPRSKSCTSKQNKANCKVECCPGVDDYGRPKNHSTHYALDGTNCGANRECYNGVCKKKIPTTRTPKTTTDC